MTTEKQPVIGTEEWFVKNDPHAAIKQRNEGMVWAIWSVILLALILCVTGAVQLLAADDPVRKITAPCKCGGTYKATGYFVNNSREDNPYVAVRWEHICRNCSRTNWLDLPYPIIQPVWTGNTNGMPIRYYAWASNSVDAVTSMPRRATAVEIAR